MQVRLTVNGHTESLDISPEMTLSEALREQLKLHSVQEGCGSGDCGSCTVLLDGQPVCACLTLAVSVAGQEILSLEGLSPRGDHPLQTAFREHFAAQCGFCTPGMILSAVGLLARSARPTEQDIRHALAGNLCRCTGYVNIVRAIQACSGSAPEERQG